MRRETLKSNKRIFKLYVKSYKKNETKNVSSVNALKYMLQNIDFLNNCQIHLKIIKIKESEMDKDMVNELASKGITDLPALVPDVGINRLGFSKIKELVETNKRKTKEAMKKQEELVSREHDANFSDNPDLAKLWGTEMNFKSFKNDNGEESPFDGGANEDFGRKIAELRRSRGNSLQAQDPLEDQPRRRRTDMNMGPPQETRPPKDHQGSNSRMRKDNMPDDRQARNINKKQEVPVVTRNQPMTDDMVEMRYMENSGLGGDY